MVVEFTITFTIYNYNQFISPPKLWVQGEVYSIQHYVIKFVSDLWQVSGFLLFPPLIKTDRHFITENIVESAVKHHNPLYHKKKHLFASN